MDLAEKIELLNGLCGKTLSITYFATGWDVHSYRDGSSKMLREGLIPDLENAIDKLLVEYQGETIMERWKNKARTFNRTFPIGTKVTYMGEWGSVESTITAPARVMSDGEPVVWITDIPGYVSLKKVVVR